jgi:hypothetical protein
LHLSFYFFILGELFGEINWCSLVTRTSVYTQNIHTSINYELVQIARFHFSQIKPEYSRNMMD